MLEYSVREAVKVIGRTMNLEDYLYMSLLLDLLPYLSSGEHNVRIYIQALPGAIVFSRENLYIKRVVISVVKFLGES